MTRISAARSRGRPDGGLRPGAPRPQASAFLNPQERFIDRLLVLRGDGEAMTVTYGPHTTDPQREIAARTHFRDDRPVIEGHISRLRELRPTDLVDLGSRLGWIALPPLIRARFLDELHTAGKRGRKVRLSILDDESGLGDVPWEYMWLQEIDFVALHPACSLIRHYPAAVDSDVSDVRALAPDEPLRVLLVYADPEIEGLPPIAAHAQVERIQHHLAHLAWPTQVTVLLPAGHGDGRHVASRAHMKRELRASAPHVVYLVAHGEFDAGHDQGVVYLEPGRTGHYDAVSAGDLARLLPRRDGPRIFLLDCCWSATRGLVAGRSVARALCAPGRAVVSMQLAWPAASGPLFWNTLFSSLTAPSPLDDCVFEAREMVSRNSLDMPEWGIPVLLRPGLSSPPRSTIVHEPQWQRELIALRDHLSGRDRDLIDELLRRLPDWRGHFDIGTWVRQRDPLFVLMAGKTDRDAAPLVTSPVWYTRLLAPPGLIEWPKGRGGPWWVSVWVSGGAVLAFRETTVPRVEFGGAERDWPRGVWIRWHVGTDPTRRTHGPALARGVFQILDAAAADQWRAHMKDDVRTRADRQVATAGWLLRGGLYDALLRRCSRLLRRRQPVRVGFGLHRLLAEAYGEMQRQLSLRSMGHPEAHWAAALARRHVEDSYRTAAGGESGMEAKHDDVLLA